MEFRLDEQGSMTHLPLLLDDRVLHHNGLNREVTIAGQRHESGDLDIWEGV